MALSFVSITDDTGAVIAPEWLPRTEWVHRQLRDQLPPGSEVYRATLERVCANGARLTLAVESETVKGLALWRIIENVHDRHLYIDDLVTDAACRSQGVGHALMDWLTQRAQSLSCKMLALTSRVQRSNAHRFYFREGFTIHSFCFRKTLT